MKTGYAQICITPPKGVNLFGYYEKRVCKGVIDDLYARAISFDDGEKRALILSIDVCQLLVSQADRIRKAISEEIGIEIGSIFVNCSHTHTGPVLEMDITGEPTDGEYEKVLFKKLLDVSLQAFISMKESTFSTGSGIAEGISFVRRYRMKNGDVQTNPGVDNPDILCPLGTPNDTVKFLKIERSEGDTLVIVNFGTHADTVGGEYISGDWPNVVCKTIETVFENTKCIFLTGSQGDVNHINTAPTARERKGLNYDAYDGIPRGYEHTKHMGRKVAAAVIATLDKTEPISGDKISYSTNIVSIPSNRENDRLDEAERIIALHKAGRDEELPYENMELTTVVAEANRICELANGPDKFDFVLTALKLGDYVIVGLPGECFTDIGRRIEKACGLENIMVCCLTNGGDSYFPTSSAYDEGGYEARSSQLRKGGDDILVEGAVKLIGKLL